MDITQKMKKAMLKDEVALLVDLIQSNPILTSKETNATTNKGKDDAWTSLAHMYNARSGSIPRTKDQLKLKWDNLKKAARKRAQQIRMNHLKTGGGKPDYIPPDEILEKVSGLLGSTCTGFNVPFGGDGVACSNVVLDVGDAVEVNYSVADIDIVTDSPNNVLNDATNVVNIEVVAETPSRDVQPKKKKFDLWEGNSSPNGEKRPFFGMPLSKQLIKNKKRKMETNDIQRSTITRNVAIANYYETKKEKLDLEIKILKLELAQKENNCKCNNSLN